MMGWLHVCFCILAWSGLAAAEDAPEDDEKAPPPESFTHEAEEPKLNAPGPWDLKPSETPVTAGPWAVDRPGSAPVEVQRDGSAREPQPPTATWGNREADPDKIDDSPWDKARSATESKLAPLGAHFPIRILGHEPDALLIEIPMLVAESREDLDGEGYWLIVEFFLEGKKVGDHRIMVEENTLATMGPTHAWVKTMIPTPSPQGEITIRVLRMDRASSEVRPMFERTLKFGN